MSSYVRQPPQNNLEGAATLGRLVGDSSTVRPIRSPTVTRMQGWLRTDHWPCLVSATPPATYTTFCRICDKRLYGVFGVNRSLSRRQQFGAAPTLAGAQHAMRLVQAPTRANAFIR